MIFDIVSSKLYTRNLLVASILEIFTLMFKIFDFAHFFVDIHPIRLEIKKSNSAKMFATSWSCYIPKIMSSGFQHRKPHIETSRNSVLCHIRLNSWPLWQETKIARWHWISENFPEVLKISKFSDITSMILVLLKKAKGRVWNPDDR